MLQTIITNVHHCSGRKVGDFHYSSASSQFTNSGKVLKSWQPLETTFQNSTDDRTSIMSWPHFAHSSGGSDSHTHTHQYRRLPTAPGKPFLSGGKEPINANWQIPHIAYRL